MSLVVTMTSVAIIAGITASQTTLAATALAVSNGSKEEIEEEGIETCFVDSALLIKTLEELDCHVKKSNENEILVATTCGNLKYARENSAKPFKMYLDEITDVQGVLENIRSFEQDYGRNVQEYTYNHIKNNLADGMTIDQEEVLDDNSIFLTINIE